MDLLENLNPIQKKAVKTTEGPILVIAGAGSGKTKVLTSRVAYLLQLGINHKNILAVTFTNKAAEEMKERIRLLMGAKEIPLIGTFHSVASWILRREKYPYEKFSIYDSVDQLSLVKETIKEQNISGEKFVPVFIKELISKVKNKLLNLEDETFPFDKESFNLLFQGYQEKLKLNKALDFDDLLLKVLELFRKKPQILGKYQSQFSYILVDEYQDTNTIQYQLINLLAHKYKNLCVVGDIDQAIYSWRGADFRNILNFEKDYPEAKIFKLEENYRSTKTILTAANQIIDKNILRKKKILWTSNQDGEKIKVFIFPNQNIEAQFVINEIKNLIPNNRQLKDFAVLYRTNAQSRVLEEACLKENIPYRVIGAFKFYERKEIKDLISYLRIVEHPYDLLSLKRIINTPPRGLGNLDKFWPEIQKNSSNTSLINVLPNKKQPSWLSFERMKKRWAELKDKLLVSDFLKRIIKDTGYLQYLNNDSVEAQSRLENISELVGIAQEFDKHNSEGLNKFLESVALIQESDNYNENKNVLNLMTLHSAKGLEFPVVFITGMEEGIFPHLKAETQQELEEERRLCYVGLTRAKEKIYLTFVKQRKYFGNILNNTPSRFLLDLPEQLIEFNGNGDWDSEEILIDY